MATVSRSILGVIVLCAGLLLAAACTPAAAPTPTTAPTKPTTAAAPAAKPSPTTAAKPAAATPAATKPAATASPAAKPAASADWQAEWDKVLAAAKKEGKVTVGGAYAAGYREAADEFKKAYPDIALEYTSMAGRDAGPKMIAERKAGVYSWDAYIGGSTTMLDPLIPEGVFEPLRPNLILPEVSDDSKWRQGFDDGYQDSGHKFAYAFFGYLSYAAWINRDVPGASAIKTLDDLLDPKWNGMIAWEDPRGGGSGQKIGGNFYAQKGAEWYRKLLANGIVPLTDTRMMMDRLARGQAVAAIGRVEEYIRDYREQGLLKNAAYLDDGTAASAHVTGGSGNLAAVDKPPHPNAQVVFINWLLSKQGQEGYVKTTGIHSRRLDVPAGADPDSLPKSGLKYLDLGKEENLKDLQAATQIAKEVLR